MVFRRALPYSLVPLGLFFALGAGSALSQTTFTLGEKGFVIGMNGHPLTQPAYRDIGLPAQMDLLKQVHAAFYRFDLPSQPDWNALDALLDQLDKNQIAAFPVLLPPGNRDKKATPEETEKKAHDYAALLTQHARGRIRCWDLSNELDVFCMLHKGDLLPDGKIYSYGAPSGWDPKHYDEKRYQLALAELRGLADGIRESDPKACLVVNTGGWLHIGFIDRLVQDQLPFDVIGWDWYSDDGALDAPEGKPLLQHLLAFRKPVWITEGNYRPLKTPEEEQKEADYLKSTLEGYSDTYPAIKTYCVYELLDESDLFQAVPGKFGDEKAYGIIHIVRGADGKFSLGKAKPALAVLAHFEP